MIRLREKIAYGFGDMASSMFWKIFGMYLLFFYTKVFGISPAAAGTMFLLTRIWDSVNDPIMGLIADRTDSRWGRYRPYILWFAIPFAFIGIATFFTPSLGETGKLVYAYITYTLMMMVYTAVNVPYASLLGTISSDSKDRNSLSSYRMFFAFGGSLITFMILQPLIDGFAKVRGVYVEEGTVSTDPVSWTMAVAVIGVICAVLFYLCFRWTKERVRPIDENKDKNTPIWQDLRSMAGNVPWWILLGAGVAALLFNSIRDGATLFYFADYVRDTSKIAFTGWTIGTVYLLVGQAANMLGVALAAPFSNRLGKKTTYILAMSVSAILSIFFYMLRPDQLCLILLFQVAISVFAGMIFPLLWSMYADIVDWQEHRDGRRATGLIFSSSSMSQKFGWAIGGAVTGWLLAAFGYDPELASQSEKAVNGVRMMMSWLPAASCILAIVAMCFYPLNERKMMQISIELEERRTRHE